MSLLVEDALELLGDDSEGLPYYLHLLNLKWSCDGAAADLGHYQAYANRIAEQPGLIAEMIRVKNWRYTLVGNAAAMLIGDRLLSKDIRWRLENGSWVAPQLSVGLALLGRGGEVTGVRRLLDEATDQSPPKLVLAAYSALKFVDDPACRAFERSAIFQKLIAADRDRTIENARRHWTYWESVTRFGEL